MSLTRADGTVTASWDAVSGATKYHVTYSSDNEQSWSAAASPADNHSANSITITGADNGKSYVVGVRAGNDDDQWSGWRNSASAGPYTPPTPNPPSAVSSVSITRADGTLTAAWDAPAGATQYHVTYTSDWGQSWTAAADAHAATSITISVDNAKAYTVGVRAGNDGGWSAWTNSPVAPSYFPPERGIIIQDAGGNPITALAVPEGGEASYYVRLAAAPGETTKVCVYISVRDKNDPDITFKGQAADVVSIDVVFTPDNWNTAQAVTLVAAEDDDYVNGARDSGLDARDYYAGKVDLAVTPRLTTTCQPRPTSPSPTATATSTWGLGCRNRRYRIRRAGENQQQRVVEQRGHRRNRQFLPLHHVGRGQQAGRAGDELHRRQRMGGTLAGANDNWLTTVQQSGASGGLQMAAAQSGASAQSAQAQSQLAAPASITVDA